MTTHSPTTDQIRTEWDGIAPRFDGFVTPASMGFGAQLLRRVDVRPGVRFLDVAAGSGALSIPAARLGAEVVAIDIAPGMIERLNARAQVERLANLDALVMDGQALEFPDDTFDVSASLNGVSVFPDFHRGLREMVRVTRREGLLLIATFGAPQKAEFLRFFMGALQASVPDFTPLPLDPPPLPFQVADPNRLHAELVDAGLVEVQVDAVTWDMHFDSARHFWDVVTSSNPIGARLVAGLTAEQRTAAQRVLDGMLRERAGGAPGAVLHVEMNVGIGAK